LEEKRDTKVIRAKPEPDEAQLTAQAKGGDKAAFGRLVKLHQRRVLRMVTAMVGDLDVAMDIVQESFIRAYHALDRFEEGQPFYPWLSTIATNLALNQLRKNKRQTSLDDSYHEQADPALDPLEKLQTDENQRRFMAAVQNLPEEYRSVFVLRTFDQLSYDEIAARLKISMGTVDSRLFRARRRLMDELKDLLE
jgi:RNA polymerase sigma factor (sigma-70 family)